MPSPTDRTCPTSVTSASVPKFLICSLRIAEISAARMSMIGPHLGSVNAWIGRWAEALTGRFHRQTNGIELGAHRGVHHAGAHLDDESADEARVDFDVEVDVGLGDVAQRRLDVVQNPIRRTLRQDDLGPDDALRLSHEFTEGANHVGQREKAALRGDETDEVADETAETGPIQDGADGAGLFLGRE